MSAPFEQCRLAQGQHGASLGEHDKPALTSKTGAAVAAQRGRSAVIGVLPVRETFAAWLHQRIGSNEANHGAH